MIIPLRIYYSIKYFKQLDCIESSLLKFSVKKTCDCIRHEYFKTNNSNKDHVIICVKYPVRI